MRSISHVKKKQTLLASLLLGSLVAATLALAPPAAAQAKQTDLESLLPADTAAFVRCTDLHGFWKALANSSLRDKLENAPIPEVRQKFLEAKNNLAAFEEMLALDLGTLAKALFGDDFLLAVFPDGQGVYLVRSANRNDLQATVDTIVGLERQWGKVLDERIEAYRGAEIVSMELTDPQKPGMPSKPRHHARIGDLLIVSRSIDVVKKIIDIRQGRGNSLAATPDYQEAGKLMRRNAICRIYLNSRNIAQSGLLDKLGNGNLRNPLFKTWYTRIKQNLQLSRYAVISIMGDATGLKIRSSFAYDELRAPASFKALMPRHDVKLDIARCRPANAVASFSNSVNKTALWKYTLQTLREFRPEIADKVEAGARHFGKSFAAMDFEKEFLGHIGDQFAVFVTPGAGDMPPELTLAVELADGELIPNCIRTQAGSLAFINWAERQKQKKTPDFSITRQKRGTVDYTTAKIHSGPVAGRITPTMCVVGKFMLLSTSADAAQAAVEAFHSPTSGASSENPGAVFSRGNIDMDALAVLLRKHNNFLVQQAVKKGAPEQKARTDWRNVEYLLSFFKSINFHASSVPGRIDRVISVNFAARPSAAKPGNVTHN